MSDDESDRQPLLTGSDDEPMEDEGVWSDAEAIFNSKDDEELDDSSGKDARELKRMIQYIDPKLKRYIDSSDSAAVLNAINLEKLGAQLRDQRHVAFQLNKTSDAVARGLSRMINSGKFRDIAFIQRARKGEAPKHFSDTFTGKGVNLGVVDGAEIIEALSRNDSVRSIALTFSRNASLKQLHSVSISAMRCRELQSACMHLSDLGYMTGFAAGNMLARLPNLSSLTVSAPGAGGVAMLFDQLKTISTLTYLRILNNTFTYHVDVFTKAMVDLVQNCSSLAVLDGRSCSGIAQAVDDDKFVVALTKHESLVWFQFDGCANSLQYNERIKPTLQRNLQRREEIGGMIAKSVPELNAQLRNIVLQYLYLLLPEMPVAVDRYPSIAKPAVSAVVPEVAAAGEIHRLASDM